jgi:hypothetical protein
VCASDIFVILILVKLMYSCSGSLWIWVPFGSRILFTIVSLFHVFLFLLL